MRLAYICCDFGVPILGHKGAAVHLRETVDALRRLGHAVQVFSADTGSRGAGVQWDDWCPIALDGVAGDVVRLLAQEDVAHGSHLPKEWRALMLAEFAQRALLPALTAFQPDAIYERYSLFAYAGVELARSMRVPLLLEVNAPLSFEQARYRDLVLKRTAADLERTILTRADAVCVVSSALADHAHRLGVPRGRIAVMPNGVDPQRFSPAVRGEEARARYNLQDKRVIGFVGSLKPWHDLETLLAATRRLVETDQRFHLLIVGEGPGMGRLKALDEAHITRTGAVGYEDVPGLLAATDVLVIPYPAGAEQYFSPLKLFEAMAMAKPVVGACVGQVPEVLVHGETGFLYEPGNPADLAGRIISVFENPGRAAFMGAAARKTVLAGRTWDHNALRLAAIAESLSTRSKVA